MVSFSKANFFLLCMLFLVPSVFAGVVDVNAWRFVTNSVGGAGTAATYNFGSKFPFLGAYRDGNIQIDFNVSTQSANGAHGILLDFNIVRSIGTVDTNTVVFVDLNLGAYKLPGKSSNLCDSNNFYAGTLVNCRFDLNIGKNFLPADGNYFVRMKVYDVNTAAQKGSALNTDISTSSNSVGIDNTPPNLTWDGNHATWQSFDANVHLTCTDYNSSGLDANNSGCGTIRYRVDSDANVSITMPTFSSYDTNVLIGPAGDGNYAFDWNVMDNAGNNMVASSTVSGTTDYNRTYVQIDKTTVGSFSVSITNPGGETFTTSSSFTLTYSASVDANASPVGTYWILITRGTTTNTVNNGTNLSYVFSDNATAKPFNVSFSVVANNAVDQNAASPSYFVGFRSTGGGGGSYCGDGYCASDENTANCAKDCKSVCGDSVCSGTESSATCPKDCVQGCGNRICEEPGENCTLCQIDCGVCVFDSTQVLAEQKLDAQPTLAQISNVLQEGQFTAQQISTAQKLRGQLTAEKKVVIKKHVTAEGTSVFEASITLTVSNPNTKSVRNVRLVEAVPKTVAQSAVQIVSEEPFTVLKNDPIISFVLPIIPSQGVGIVSYSVSSPVAFESNVIDSFVPVVVASFSEAPGGGAAVTCGSDAQCNDDTACTKDRCVKGACAYVSVENGTVCGFGKECQEGICVESSTQLQKQPAETMPLLGLIALVIIVVLLGIYAFGKTSKK